MIRKNLKTFLSLVSIVLLLCTAQSRALFATGKNLSSKNLPTAQFDDPYADFRNVRYSNAGLLSERDEVKLGTQLHRQVTKKYNLTDVGLDRIERLGQRCARASVRPNILYKFHVLQMKEINGFSLPGGHIYITSALLKLANDNELASVLCHEVGHIAARHSLKTLKKRQEYNDIAKSIGEITGIAGDIGRELGEAIGQMAGEGILTFHSQDEEREADFLGVRDMTKAGFDAQGMITMFQKLQRIENQSPNLLGSLFSDHPDVQERIDNTRYEIARMRRR
ncbi:MAG TPA: M48 family metalloprotease [Pyrinomonadaceae bacterium]|jgi:predicted Zn-dependent protease|nr:M48 family metalloprotease [Pyrinomonadaceae bacterium]